MVMITVETPKWIAVTKTCHAFIFSQYISTCDSNMLHILCSGVEFQSLSLIFLAIRSDALKPPPPHTLYLMVPRNKRGRAWVGVDSWNGSVAMHQTLPFPSLFLYLLLESTITKCSLWIFCSPR